MKRSVRQAERTLHVKAAVIRGNVLRGQQDRFGLISTHVPLAPARGQHAAVGAQGHLDYIGGLLETVVRLIHADLGDDPVPQHRSRVVHVFILQDDLLRLIVSAPNSSGIVRGIAGKPPVMVAAAGAGLSGNADALDLGLHAGSALNGFFQHISQIPGGLFIQHRSGILRIVQHQIALAVEDLGEGPGLPVDALIGDGSVSGCQIANRNAVHHSAEGQRPIAFIGIIYPVKLIVFYQGVESHVVDGVIIGIVKGQIVEHLHRHGITGGFHGLENIGQSVVDPVLIIRPGGGTEGERRIVINSSRRDQAKIQGRSVYRQRFDGGSRRQKALGGIVPGQAARLFAHTAHHGGDIAGFVVNNDNGGLKLLIGAFRCGDVFQVLVYFLRGSLGLYVDGGVDLIPAAQDHLIDHVRVITRRVDQLPDHIPDHSIYKVGVIRRVIRIVGVTGRIVKDQLLGNGAVVFLFRNITLIEHLIEDIVLPGLVPLPAVIRNIGIVERRIVGDSDQAGTLGKAELGDILGKIGIGSRPDAISLFSQIDGIEIPFQDLFFIILFLHLQRAEDLHELPADRDLVVAGQVLHQLLGDGGCAVGAVRAHKEVRACPHGTKPVHTVMLKEPLVLDGNCGIDQIIRDLIIGSPDPVFIAVEILKGLKLSGLLVLIVDHGGLVQPEAVQRKGNLRHQIIPEIGGKDTGENHHGDHKHQQQRSDYSSEMPEKSFHITASLHVFIFHYYKAPPRSRSSQGRRNSIIKYIISQSVNETPGSCRYFPFFFPRIFHIFLPILPAGNGNTEERLIFSFQSSPK